MPVCLGTGAYPDQMASDAPDPDAGQPAPDELRDAALHEEIELVGQLVVAATSNPDRLSQAEIDHVLGVDEEG